MSADVNSTSTNQLTVPVTGMTCDACEKRVSRALLRLPGVESVRVSSARGTAALVAPVGEALPTRDRIDAALRSAGYEPGAPRWLTRDGSVWTTVFITGAATIPLLAVLSFISGTLNGLWWPAYSGLIPDVVEDEHLQPANAYVSVASNGGLIAGNAIGGLLVAGFGAGTAIAVDAVSFLVAGLLVFTFRHVSEPHSSGESMLGDLAHGWRVFISFRWVVVVTLAFSLIVMVLRGAEEVMGPVLAIEHYGGAAGWAVVLGCMSVGLLIGAVTASRITIRRPMLFGMLICLTLPAWLICLAFALPLWAVAAGAFAWGLAIELFQVLWFTALQTHVPREALSRVGSYDAMGSLMFGPIGLALAGPLITAIGLQAGFLIAAAVATAAIVGSLFSRAVRQLRAQEAA